MIDASSAENTSSQTGTGFAEVRRFTSDAASPNPTSISEVIQRPIIDISTGDPRSSLESLAVNEQQMSLLNVLAAESSLLKWGVMDSKEKYLRSQEEWGQSMTEWGARMEQKNPQLYKQIKAIARFISAKPGADAQAQIGQDIDWVAFHRDIHGVRGKKSIDAFVSKLKTMPGIAENVKGMEAISRIFGKEVHHKLFGEETPAEVHDRQREWSRAVVEKAFKADKIDEAKRDRLLAKVDERAESLGFLVNSVEIDSQFTSQEKAQIQKMLRTIPADLLKNIGRVYRIMDDVTFAGLHSQMGKHLEISSIGITSSALKYSAENRKYGWEGNPTEGVFYHEILGHGLRHYVMQLDKGLGDELRELVMTATEGMMRKDQYASRYLNNDPTLKSVSYSRSGIPAAVDEFWADRMAEWWGARNNKKIEENMVQGAKFTPAEQARIDQVCERTFDIFNRAAAYKKELDARPKGFIARLLSPKPQPQRRFAQAA